MDWLGFPDDTDGDYLMLSTRRDFLNTLSAGAAGLAAERAAAQERRPNILLILADDMGFSDLGSYGSEIDTPNLDRLAQGGVRFTQFYNCARCCPSRAALLTGLYPHQAGIGHMVDTVGPAPGYSDDLSPHSQTIAQVLQASGYYTGMVGKWHVTPVNRSKHNWPLQRGFQSYYGIIHGAADYFNPVTLTSGNQPVAPDTKNYYFTDALGDHGVRFLQDAARQDKPFFLYAAFTAPHWPLHAHPDDIRKHENRYLSGWDALREERHSRQLAIGMLEKRWDLSPRDSRVPQWKDASDRRWQARRMAVYAAMVDCLDRNIGRMLDQLKMSGQEENTLVLFMADNGGCAEEVRPNWKGLHIPARTRDGRPVRVGNLPSVVPGAEDTYQSYGLPWANASNTPFRLYKHWVHEGGISTPLIARWPKRFRPSKTFLSQPAHFIDVMSTCVDAAQAHYPTQAGGSSIIPMQGKSLLPTITGKPHVSERDIFWEHEGNRAMRRGPWKLVRKYPGPWELYNMDDDRTELHDRAHDRGALLKEMAAEWEAWAKRSNVLPWEDVVHRLKSR